MVTDKEDVQERNWLNNGKMQVVIMIMMVMMVVVVMVVVMVVINWLELERSFLGFRTSGSRQRSTSSTTATTARAAHPPPLQTLRITRSVL